MKKNQKNNNTAKADRPVYHIFENAVLNEIFCPTEEESQVFLQNMMDVFIDKVVKRIDVSKAFYDKKEGDRMCRLLFTHMCAHIETAFELGWREAMNREAVPQLRLMKERMDAHIAHLELDCKHAGNPWEDEQK